MSGFFSEEEVKNEGAKIPWDKIERDKALDEYFAGAHPKKLGIKYKKAPKAFMNSILNKLRYNYKKKGQEDGPGRAERYKPVRRVWRGGMRLTPNELDLIRCHKEAGVDVKHTARILQRPISDFHRDTKGHGAHEDLKKFGPGVDLILAYRFCYYVKGVSIVSDHAYDEIEAEEKEFGACSKVLETVGSDREDDYPPHIRALAMYLIFKYCERKKE